jgi:hypothetical protein
MITFYKAFKWGLNLKNIYWSNFILFIDLLIEPTIFYETPLVVPRVSNIFKCKLIFIESAEAKTILKSYKTRIKSFLHLKMSLSSVY